MRVIASSCTRRREGQERGGEQRSVGEEHARAVLVDGLATSIRQKYGRGREDKEEGKRRRRRRRSTTQRTVLPFLFLPPSLPPSLNLMLSLSPRNMTLISARNPLLLPSSIDLLCLPVSSTFLFQPLSVVTLVFLERNQSLGNKRGAGCEHSERSRKQSDETQAGRGREKRFAWGVMKTGGASGPKQAGEG
eukprot:471251-Rhodomonas_salina.2